MLLTNNLGYLFAIKNAYKLANFLSQYSNEPMNKSLYVQGNHGNLVFCTVPSTTRRCLSHTKSMFALVNQLASLPRTT